jgi:hypothetical protein
MLLCRTTADLKSWCFSVMDDGFVLVGSLVVSLVDLVS